MRIEDLEFASRQKGITPAFVIKPGLGEWSAERATVACLPTRKDPIAVVEACYDLGAAESAWLQAIADSFVPLVANEVGLLGYHVDIDERGPLFRSPVQAGAPSEAFDRIQNMGALLDRDRRGETSLLEHLKAKLYARVVRNGMEERADALLLGDMRLHGPRWMYTLGLQGVQDVFHLRSHHIDGNGLTMLVAGLSKEGALNASQRAAFHMISAHIKAGLRLRRQLKGRSRSVNAPAEGAILDASGSMLHAEGEAQEESAREALQYMAKEIDRARTGASGRDEKALEVWQGLVDGRWSLVEQFDSDGKRFMLAHKNPEGVLDPRGLTSMEARVSALAARGYGNKLIGYHLGMTEGTVSSHLARAMAKLRLASRVELVRIFGQEAACVREPGGLE